MQFRASLAVITVAVLVGFGGSGACKRETAQSAREVAKKQEAAPNEARSSAAKKSTDSPEEPGPGSKNPSRAPTGSAAPGTQTSGAAPVARVITAKSRAVVETEERLLARWNDIRSFSAKLSTSFEQREGAKMRFEGEGTYDYLTKDGKTFIRSKQARDVYVDAGGAKATDGTALDRIFTGQRLLKILDGDYVYEVDVRHEQFGGLVVKKLLPHPLAIQFAGGKTLFKWLDQADELRLLPDETLDGKQVYVFETVTLTGRMKTLCFFDKETGILLKLTSEGEQPSLKSTFALSDIQLNVPFSDDHFTYTAPSGVEVQDLTGRQP